MTPTHAVKKGVRYCYYVSRRRITERRTSDAHGAQSGHRLPAIELERIVTYCVRDFFADPDEISQALPTCRGGAPSHKRMLAAAQAIVRTMDKGEEDLTTFVLRPLLAKVTVTIDSIKIDLSADAVGAALQGGDQAKVAAALFADPTSDKLTREREDANLIRLSIPARLKRAGQEMKFIVDGIDDTRIADPALIRLLRRAHALSHRMANNPASTLEDIGAQESMGAPYAARLMRLNYLAPEIVVAILIGRQPADLTATKLIADTRLPMDWTAQLQALGFPK